LQLSWLQLPCFQSYLFIYLFNECCDKCFDFQVLIIRTLWYICIISVLALHMFAKGFCIFHLSQLKNGIQRSWSFFLYQLVFWVGCE
jgi:hypothetical protein